MAWAVSEIRLIAESANMLDQRVTANKRNTSLLLR